MRTRTQIEAEAKEIGRARVVMFNRKDMLFLEVLLDIRDGLYEDQARPTKGIEA